MSDWTAFLKAAPTHLFTVVVALLVAILSDKVVTILFFATIALVLTSGWVAVGVVLVVYAILLFAYQAFSAFLAQGNQ